ncbi:MAG TPA: hypothetical protein VIX63_11075 [Vicinamibacterales bacterium]
MNGVRVAASDQTAAVDGRGNTRMAFAFAILLAAAIACNLWRAPIQVFDSLSEILDAQGSPSVAASFEGALGSSAYLRPLRIAQIKTLFDAAGGHYQLAYRGFHVVLLFALVLLFVGALRVESREDLAAAVFALMVLTGLHTFIGFVREAFPINHFLEIAVLCLAALNLARARAGWWVDAAACLVLVCALLTLESGVLVWVVLASAWIVGLRGVSGRGLAVATALLIGYFLLRVELATGMPALGERSTGFLLERLDPADLQRQFGDSPHALYGYNVAASLGSVLFAEPRDGTFMAVRAWRDGDVPARVYLTVLSSLATTVLIVWTLALSWRRSRRGASDRMIFVAAAVLVASAVLSFAYTKDEIMAVAGVYYAVAAYVAARLVLQWARRTNAFVAVVCVSMLLTVLASAWAVRSIGVHHVLRVQISRVRNDWAELPLRLRREERWPADSRRVALIEQLRTEALQTPPVNGSRRWNDRWFGD